MITVYSLRKRIKAIEWAMYSGGMLLKGQQRVALADQLKRAQSTLAKLGTAQRSVELQTGRPCMVGLDVRAIRRPGAAVAWEGVAVIQFLDGEKRTVYGSTARHGIAQNAQYCKRQGAIA